MRLLANTLLTPWASIGGIHAEKADLHPRRISQLRLDRTASDDLNRFQFPLALPIPQ